MTAIWLCLFCVAAPAAPPRDRLTLLVPDGADLTSWQVKVWTDSAAEEGLRMDVISDTAFLALGTTAAAKIAALVMPDSAHISASDAVVAAVKQYTQLGGRLMLVYDAGAQSATGFFPLTGNSRFADLVGVQYVLWNNGAGANTMVGFGPVVGTQAQLDALSFAPGKYMPYTAPANAAVATAAAYVPTSQYDPGGSQLMTRLIAQRAEAVAGGAPAAQAVRRAAATEGTGLLRFRPASRDATPALTSLGRDDVAALPADRIAARFSVSTGLAVESRSALTNAAATASLQAISGYLYGPLSYYSYVTTGTYTGTSYLASPAYGLVAGQRAYGSGQVMFVNLPLGFFKAIGTDAAPLQGFLSFFGRDQVGLSTLSVQPRGKGGLIYNWHMDDGDQLNTDARNLLAQTRVFNRGPYSIQFTAGPDVNTVGDGLGMALSTNASSQDVVRHLGNLGTYASLPAASKLPAHELGSHGGWIHNYWGATANESNVPDLTSLLVQNFAAVQGVTGRAIREYSSPQGNTPLWAIKWIEAKGVVGMYLVGDIGATTIRSWRNGARVSNKLWTFPVSPLGLYATFEEFEENNVSDATSGQWLLDLQSFVVNHRSSRLFYNHPPGAAGHLPPINALLTRADTLQAAGTFAWYTMAQLADYAQRRVDATWTTSVDANGVVSFIATHPTALTDLTWLLPKAKWGAPSITAGAGVVVTTDATNWIVTANSGTSFQFKSAAL